MKREVTVTLPDLDLAGVPCRATVWHARLGEWVNQGDRLLEVVANGILVDIPAPASGFLRRRLVLEEDRVAPGQMLAVIEEDEVVRR